MMKIIYIAHAYSGNPEKNRRLITNICQALKDTAELHSGPFAGPSNQFCPVAPQLYFDAFLSEKTERPKIINLCCTLVTACAEVWTFGRITRGMRLEIETAHRYGKPVRAIYFDGNAFIDKNPAQKSHFEPINQAKEDQNTRENAALQPGKNKQKGGKYRKSENAKGSFSRKSAKPFRLLPKVTKSQELEFLERLAGAAENDAFN